MAVESVNPVFVNFSVTNENVKAGAEPVAQRGDLLLKHLSAGGAKMGYGIGYAGTPVAGNISYDGPDVPFSDALSGIKWGRAALCTATVSEGVTTLTEISGVNGVCYGTTVKDSSVQLNASFAVPQGIEFTPSATLVAAIFCNASVTVDGSDITISESGETVVAISDAIDPTVILGDVTFAIPSATGGYTFTVRGTLAKAPFVNHVSDYTSMKDRVTSFPTSQAIIDAKVNALANT